MRRLLLILLLLWPTATLGQVVDQGQPSATSDAASWPFKVVFGGAQIDPRDTTDRAGRLLGQVTFPSAQPVTQADQSVTGSITSTACPGTGCVVLASTAGIGTVAFQISGSFSATLIAEISVNGTLYAQTGIISTEGIWDDGIFATARTAFVPSSGAVSFRIRATAYSAGTVDVTIRAAPASSVSWNLSSSLEVPVNLGQVAGTTVNSNNGAAGIATQRVTIANNSTGTIRPWDGVNFMPAMDVAARSGFQQLTDGTDTAQVTATGGGSLQVECSAGCGSVAQAQTYYAIEPQSAGVASKDYLTLFNGAGSGKVIKVLKIWFTSHNTAAVTGTQITLSVERTTTGGTTCTALTIQLADTTNTAVPAQVTANSTCTTDPTVDYLLTGGHSFLEETSVINTGEATNTLYRFENSGGQPLTLREGQGVMIRATALAPVGLITVTVEFTM